MRVQTFNRHPKRPDELRIEQLQQPWEGEADGAAADRIVGLAGVEFDTSCAMKPPQLFSKDGKSIFIPGEPCCSLQGVAKILLCWA